MKEEKKRVFEQIHKTEKAHHEKKNNNGSSIEVNTKKYMWKRRRPTNAQQGEWKQVINFIFSQKKKKTSSHLQMYFQFFFFVRFTV